MRTKARAWLSFHAGALSAMPGCLLLLSLLHSPLMAQDKEWLSESFWRTATVEDVESALRLGSKISAHNEEESTPLHFASGYSNTPAVVELLLNHGGSLIEIRNKAGLTPLHWAAEMSKSPEVVEVLLDRGAGTGTRDKNGFTPLHKAASSNQTPAVVRLLLDRGADIGTRDYEYEASPLHWAAGNSKTPEVVEVFLDRGADINDTDKNGSKPLHWAAANSKTPTVIELLLDRGADIEVRDKESPPPPVESVARTGIEELEELLMSISSAVSETVELTEQMENLIGSEASEEVQRAATKVKELMEEAEGYFDPPPVGLTPLHWAARGNETPAVVKVLLDRGANIEAINEDGRTPLHLAAAGSQTPAVVDLLLNRGADPQARDNSGNTPFDAAQNNEALKDTIAYQRLNEAQ